MTGDSLGSFLLRYVIKSRAFYFCHLTCTRHSEMDIKTQTVTQECQAGTAEQVLQCKSSERERERIAAASTFQGQLCGRETKGCRLWRLVAPGCNSCLLLWSGTAGKNPAYCDNISGRRVLGSSPILWQAKSQELWRMNLQVLEIMRFVYSEKLQWL